jgi:hypothetical protein
MPDNVEPVPPTEDVPLPGLDATPDPGNAPPEEWTADLDDDELDTVYADLNDTAVHLPEPGSLVEPGSG